MIIAKHGHLEIQQVNADTYELNFGLTNIARSKVLARIQMEYDARVKACYCNTLPKNSPCDFCTGLRTPEGVITARAAMKKIAAMTPAEVKKALSDPDPMIKAAATWELYKQFGSEEIAVVLK